MEKKRLIDSLEELHDELNRSEAVHEHTRELLGSVIHDARELLAESGDAREAESTADQPALSERLRDATRSFEESHPALAAAVGRVMDALSNLGI